MIDQDRDRDKAGTRVPKKKTKNLVLGYYLNKSYVLQVWPNNLEKHEKKFDDFFLSRMITLSRIFRLGIFFSKLKFASNPTDHSIKGIDCPTLFVGPSVVDRGTR